MSLAPSPAPSVQATLSLSFPAIHNKVTSHHDLVTNLHAIHDTATHDSSSNTAPRRHAVILVVLSRQSSFNDATGIIMPNPFSRPPTRCDRASSFCPWTLITISFFGGISSLKPRQTEQTQWSTRGVPGSHHAPCPLPALVELASRTPHLGRLEQEQLFSMVTLECACWGDDRYATERVPIGNPIKWTNLRGAMQERGPPTVPSTQGVVDASPQCRGNVKPLREPRPANNPQQYVSENEGKLPTTC